MQKADFVIDYSSNIIGKLEKTKKHLERFQNYLLNFVLSVYVRVGELVYARQITRMDKMENKF